MKQFVASGALIFLTIFALMMGGCSNNKKSDAYGQFEATEITVSAKASGDLLSFIASEGSVIKKGQKVGTIDTVQLALKRDELMSQREVSESKMNNIDAEIAVKKEQLSTAEKTLKRIQAMRVDGAATDQQLDEAEGKVQTIQKQIHVLETQKGSVRAEIESIEARLQQVQQQLYDTRIVNPVTGTVLTTFVDAGELVGEGRPLYQIADLDTLELRVYISGAQLPGIKLGQQVTVLVDKNADENKQLTGTVSWIASQAEFTPSMIQTKEERVTQVYAVKVKVPNPEGTLKIGMPGEVNF